MRRQATSWQTMQTSGAVMIKQVLQAATEQLQESDTAQLDAQLLLAHALNKPRSWLYAWPEYIISASEQAAFTTLLSERVRGVPVAYLLGTKDFWNFTLNVNPAVLIPRPETELLVALALEHGVATSAVVADLGTGSGAIALALASERPLWQVYAIDNSAAAMQVARQNCNQLGLNNVTLLQGSWCEPLPAQSFDMILSNPPYMAADDEHLASGDVRFEPQSALVAAAEGLLDIKAVAEQSWHRLVAQGLLLLEHGWQQGEATRAILHELGYSDIATHTDHGGRERATVGRKP